MAYRLLNRFQEIFTKGPYLHRNSSLGDSVAIEFYEDMLQLGVSAEFNKRVMARSLVVNTHNKITGKASRRGDGTLGDLVPNTDPRMIDAFRIARGPTATMRIGVEVKILAKSMIKQIDRVMNDLNKQEREFALLGKKAIKIAFVGINWSDKYLSFEGERSYYAERSPSSEAGEAKRRIISNVTGFDELIFLEFKASNEPPYSFQWVNSNGINQLYSAALLRTSQAIGDQLG